MGAGSLLTRRSFAGQPHMLCSTWPALLLLQQPHTSIHVLPLTVMVSLAALPYSPQLPDHRLDRLGIDADRLLLVQLNASQLFGVAVQLLRASTLRAGIATNPCRSTALSVLQSDCIEWHVLSVQSHEHYYYYFFFRVLVMPNAPDHC